MFKGTSRYELIKNVVPYSCEGIYLNCVYFVVDHEQLYLFLFFVHLFLSKGNINSFYILFL